MANNTAKFGNSSNKNGSFTPKNTNLSGGIKELTLFDAINTNKIDTAKEILTNHTISQSTKDVYLIKTLYKYNKHKQSSLLESIELLLDFHADLGSYTKNNNVSTSDTPDRESFDDKESAFLFAISIGEDKLFDIVLKYVKDINMVDSQNRNAFFYLIKSKINITNIEANLDKLLKKNLNLDDFDISTGHYPITYAVSKNLEGVTKLLLSYKANPNHQNQKDGNTSLHYAVKKQNLNIVKMIINTNCDLHIKNIDNLSALDLSIRLNYTSMYEILATENDRRIEAIKKLPITQPTPAVTTQEKVIDDIFETLGVENNTNINSTNVNNTNTNINNVLTNNSAKKSNTINTSINNSDTKSKKSYKNINSYSEQYKRYALNLAGTGENNYSDVQISIDIPCSFESEEKSNSNNNTLDKNQMNSYLKLISNPVVHIDISDDDKRSKFLSTTEKDELIKKIDELNYNLNVANTKNKHLQDEKSFLTNDLKNKNSQISHLQEQNTDYDRTIEELKMQLSLMMENTNKLEKENGELKSALENYNSSKTKGVITDIKATIPRKDYLENKFLIRVTENQFIYKCLTKDILDYREFIKERMKSIIIIQEELISLVQEALNEVSNEYETKTWKKSILFIEQTTVPIIKIKTSDKYRNLQIDISMQDTKHFGLKCVDLVKSFVKEYEALEPLTLALKNLIKNAKLNDPFMGGISSYGLILLIVAFLQILVEKNQNIGIGETNLGKIFLEFLRYHGKIVNHSSYIIFAYPPNDKNAKLDIDKFFLSNQHFDLIIIDPLNHVNNIAKNTHQLANIKMAFMLAYVVANEDCDCECHYNKLLDDKESARTEHCLLKRIFKAVKRFNYDSDSTN